MSQLYVVAIVYTCHTGVSTLESIPVSYQLAMAERDLRTRIFARCSNCNLEFVTPRDVPDEWQCCDCGGLIKESNRCVVIRPVKG